MIPLHPPSHAAIAIVSRLCEAHAHDVEATIADLLKLPGAEETMTWKVLAELVRAGVVIEGFDPGGYRIIRDPGAITLLEVVAPFEPLLQDDCRKIAKAMRPTVQQYFRSITFSACASACPSESNSPEPGNCPRAILGMSDED